MLLAGQTKPRLAPRRVLADVVDCVANVICDRPARRAASMTVMTDWCVLLASALMITTLSVPSTAAPSAAATASTLRSVTAALFTT